MNKQAMPPTPQRKPEGEMFVGESVSKNETRWNGKNFVGVDNKAKKNLPRKAIPPQDVD